MIPSVTAQTLSRIGDIRKCVDSAPLEAAPKRPDLRLVGDSSARKSVPVEPVPVPDAKALRENEKQLRAQDERTLTIRVANLLNEWLEKYWVPDAVGARMCGLPVQTFDAHVRKARKPSALLIRRLEERLGASSEWVLFARGNMWRHIIAPPEETWNTREKKGRKPGR